jgi:hypothetical protein
MEHDIDNLRIGPDGLMVTSTISRINWRLRGSDKPAAMWHSINGIANCPHLVGLFQTLDEVAVGGGIFDVFR